jgi:hypothetical protein
VILASVCHALNIITITVCFLALCGSICITVRYEIMIITRAVGPER